MGHEHRHPREKSTSRKFARGAERGAAQRAIDVIAHLVPVEPT